MARNFSTVWRLAIDGKAFRKRLRGFVAALKKLQTFLGEENDAEMAQHYFARLAEDER